MLIPGHNNQRADSKFGITRYIQLEAFNDAAGNASYFKLNIKSEAVTYGFEKIK